MDSQAEDGDQVEASEHEGELKSRGPLQLVGGKPLPLNSRRLTAPVLKQLAGALDLPSTAPLDDVRQMIEGKLLEMGREPRNTQVLLQEAARGVHVSLQDVDGIFLEAEPPVRAESPNGGSEQGEGLGEPGADDTEPLRQALHEAECEKHALQQEVRAMREELESVRARVKEMWRVNCAQLSEFDAAITAKDDELAKLRRQLAPASHASRDGSPDPSDPDGTHSPAPTHLPEFRQTASSRSATNARRGKAPPVDPFTGEEEDTRFDDWLPALRRASAWNGWSEEDLLLQLAGHLRGRALQEWELLDDADKDTFSKGVDALRARLDPGSKALAAQDFRHTSQREDESVNSFIRRMERTFRIAYGRDGLGPETRAALLYGQLHEGLRYDIMKAPAVSGAQSYETLCVAAKSEERRLAELRKRQQYRKASSQWSQPLSGGKRPSDPKSSTEKPPIPKGNTKCDNCGKIGHVAAKCWSKKSESQGRTPIPRRDSKSATKQVHTAREDPPSRAPKKVDPLDLLLSDSEEETVRLVRLTDKGSVPQEGAIQVHQSRVCPCPSEFPAGYFWYGSKRRGPGRPPKWTEALMQRGQLTGECFAEADDSTEEADAQAGSSDEPTESAGLEADTCTACDEMPPPRTSGRYSLRRQVQAPD